ncbi:MAG: glycogen synthase 2 [Planctomycetota bacterium]|nr:MAG: glycogen synthase 2 [Planctomycetota bacterium]
MRVLWAVSELAPLCATGGLGAVAGALASALRARNLEVEAAIPLYGEVRRRWNALGLQPPLPVLAVQVELGRQRLVGTVLAGRCGRGLPVYLVDCPPLYEREGIYGAGGRDFSDNALRFSFFCHALRALCEARAAQGVPFDLVHTHDWQTGLLPALLRAARPAPPRRAAVVHTVHNLAYQGVFPAEAMPLTGLDWDQFTHERLEFYGNVCFLKGGLVYADRITTVSPTYAREICTPAYGYGLEGLLLARSADLVGILNGIDFEEWDPARDPHLAAPYHVEDLGGKRACRQALRAELGLTVEEAAPVLAVVSRLAYQKGVDLLLEALDEIMAHGVGLVVLGHGEPELERALHQRAERYPGRMVVRIGYDEPLAHRIFAGADLLLMPSRYEPCGLSQMQAMRYGTVPVVRRTGGLADTVEPVGRDATERGTGFVFEDADPKALADAVARALALWPERRLFRSVVQRGMRRDWSWARAAAQYEKLYRELVPSPGGA